MCADTRGMDTVSTAHTPACTVYCVANMAMCRANIQQTVRLHAIVLDVTVGVRENLARHMAISVRLLMAWCPSGARGVRSHSMAFSCVYNMRVHSACWLVCGVARHTLIYLGQSAREARRFDGAKEVGSGERILRECHGEVSAHGAMHGAHTDERISNTAWPSET
jgi:hypothetical protein